MYLHCSNRCLPSRRQASVLKHRVMVTSPSSRAYLSSSNSRSLCLTGSQLSRISWACCPAFSQERGLYLESATYVIDLEVVVRDGSVSPYG